jgi:hypothetical protein
MNKVKIKELLKDYDVKKIEKYVEYLNKLETDKKEGELVNPWMKQRSDEQLAAYYRNVSIDGMDLDGVHITVQRTGVSYDYIAYKNKMYLSYPESVFDVQLVRETDLFSVQKDSGHVIYTHKINDVFNNKPVVGAYCVIKNKRGEYLTVLSLADLEKHRKVAKTQAIWNVWKDEMYLKTVAKKGCKLHFADIYQNIETIDNENYDIERGEGVFQLSNEVLTEIEELKTEEECVAYLKKNKDKYIELKEDFVKEVNKRKIQIMEDF